MDAKELKQCHLTYKVGEGIVDDLAGLTSTNKDGGLDVLLGLGLSVLEDTLHTGIARGNGAQHGGING